MNKWGEKYVSETNCISCGLSKTAFVSTIKRRINTSLNWEGKNERTSIKVPINVELNIEVCYYNNF